MSLIDRVRDWWQVQTGEEDTPFDGDMPAWLVSLLVNMCILVGLALLGGTEQRKENFLVLTTTEPVEEVDLDVPEEFYFSNQQEEEIGANSVGGTDAALAMAPTLSEVSDIPTPALETIPDSPTSDIRIQEEITLATGPHFSETVVVRGAAGVGATGATGAIDRITHEIILSLEQRKTLVVWMFDETGSLEMQRPAILERFDRIYNELGVVEASGNPAFKKHDDKPLLTAVVGFGQSINFLTPKPTDQLDEIKSAVSSIKNDNSGIERTFTAIHQAVERYRTYRTQEPRRNVMIVVFTDEAGNDQDSLDRTVVACRNLEIPVYVIGVPAPFGRREALIKYVPPKEFEQTTMWVPVEQGPESFLPEVLKLGFSGQGEFDEPMDSGFGPYSLTRLCYETGGIYFTVHPNRNANRAVRRNETALLAAQLTYFFDPEIMRSYRPDYVSIKEYKRLMAENKARQALVQAAQMSYMTPMERPQMNFPKISEADLANRLSLAQRAAAVLEPKIAQLYDILKSGEKDRPKLTQPRWQAGFDLAMGRVLAVKVRTEAYNAMLAKAKQGMKFKNPKNDTWVLKPADEISVGSTLEKQAEQAKMYLTRVMQEHKDTPWALLAQRELQEPLGWTWEERYTGVMAPREGPGNNNPPPPPADDKVRMLEKPKPKAPLPKL